jgi:hypothetical protein
MDKEIDGTAERMRNLNVHSSSSGAVMSSAAEGDQHSGATVRFGDEDHRTTDIGWRWISQRDQEGKIRSETISLKADSEPVPAPAVGEIGDLQPTLEDR